MAFTEVTVKQSIASERFKFENPGDSIEGKYVAKETVDFDDKDVNKYVFETTTGAKSFLGSFKLDEFMGGLEIGTVARITYTKKERLKGGKTLKVFKFEIDNDAASEAKAS